jgi:hypothetical protein
MEILGVIAYWALVYITIAVFWACVPTRIRHLKCWAWPLDMILILIFGPRNGTTVH